ncbi:DUF2063 domain-containing protein [Aurantimonas sp. VKM B-3413]|uniref:HvfC/BufC N-terminal domain-containing protein n=1 Tax=Aurantimonas sp. VKM B-3413 TaxID=2779401 RepID=UPI001E3FF02E|nr:DNA-binding domain-containing protein [Aurantimonas sp. VKM B-3413]MCB8836201.1 putative DNA-binding domain-containing protein [Aurantimonas sp. VKM B-3413]
MSAAEDGASFSESGQGGFLEALRGGGDSIPDGLATRSGRRDRLRFAVYRNNVHVGLVGALEKRFPVTRRLVGDEFFRGMARVFVVDCKPETPVLIDYGEGFPDFVAAFPPAASLPYLADVARLESALSQSYHAADAIPLSLDDLARVPPEELADQVLHLHPATRLVSSGFPVGTIWSNHQPDPVRPVEIWRGETVVLTRPLAEVKLTVIPVEDEAFVCSVFAGKTLEAAAAAGAGGGFDFGRALVALVSLGCFREGNEQCVGS